jgi:hypothetical protein
VEAAISPKRFHKVKKSRSSAEFDMENKRLRLRFAEIEEEIKAHP